jgi:hypothetical protein
MRLIRRETTIVDAIRFDALVHAVEATLPRRGALGNLLGLGLVAFLPRLAIEVVSARKRKRKKKEKRCKGGKKRCGKICCSSGDACLAGACCPADRSCGATCCPAGQLCADAETQLCVTGQGACPSGANVCDGNLSICNNNSQCGCFESTLNTTRCGKVVPSPVCGQCSADADCALIFPDIAGVFCMKVGSGSCPCSPGQNQCAAPCPT